MSWGLKLEGSSLKFVAQSECSMTVSSPTSVPCEMQQFNSQQWVFARIQRQASWLYIEEMKHFVLYARIKFFLDTDAIPLTLNTQVKN